MAVSETPNRQCAPLTQDSSISGRTSRLPLSRVGWVFLTLIMIPRTKLRQRLTGMSVREWCTKRSRCISRVDTDRFRSRLYYPLAWGSNRTIPSTNLRSHARLQMLLLLAAALVMAVVLVVLAVVGAEIEAEVEAEAVATEVELEVEVAVAVAVSGPTPLLGGKTLSLVLPRQTQTPAGALAAQFTIAVTKTNS